jgi:hypothetical protein
MYACADAAKVESPNMNPAPEVNRHVVKRASRLNSPSFQAKSTPSWDTWIHQAAARNLSTMNSTTSCFTRNIQAASEV